MIVEPTDRQAFRDTISAIYMRGRRWSTYGPTRPAAAAPDRHPCNAPGIAVRIPAISATTAQFLFSDLAQTHPGAERPPAAADAPEHLAQTHPGVENKKKYKTSTNTP
jgi:hypothetical protein